MNFISKQVDHECPDAVLPVSPRQFFQYAVVFVLSTLGLIAGLSTPLLLSDKLDVVRACVKLSVYMLPFYLAGFGFFYPLPFVRRCIYSALTALGIYYGFLLVLLGMQAIGVLRFGY